MLAEEIYYLASRLLHVWQLNELLELWQILHRRGWQLLAQC